MSLKTTRRLACTAHSPASSLSELYLALSHLHLHRQRHFHTSVPRHAVPKLHKEERSGSTPAQPQESNSGGGGGGGGSSWLPNLHSRAKPVELRKTPAQRAATAAQRAKDGMKAQHAAAEAQAARQGGLAKNSLFANEDQDKGVTKDEEPKDSTQERDKDANSLETRSASNMAAALNPRPNARARWQRMMVIRHIRRGGRLTREMKIARTERSHLSRSHFFKTSMKKLAPLARQIAGKSIEEAILQMRFSAKKAARDVRQHLIQARDEAIAYKGMGLRPPSKDRTDEVVASDPSITPPLAHQNPTKSLRDGTVPHETDIYIAQAWTNRGPYGKEPEFRARGRVNILRPPHTGISILLKEEKTKVRETAEKEVKAIRKRTEFKPDSQAPDAKNRSSQNLAAAPTFRSRGESSIVNSPQHNKGVKNQNNGKSSWSNLLPPNTSSLDIHAGNYIPLYLRAINDFPAQIIPCCPLRTIDFVDYISSYAGHSFIRPIQAIPLPPLAPSESHNEKLVLNAETYSAYFSTLLQDEFAALATNLQKLCIYATPVRLEVAATQLYRFTIPGLRESSPRIDLGDTIRVRPFYPPVNSELVAHVAQNWYAAGCPPKTQSLAGCSGVEFLGVVWGIDRAREHVVLRLDMDLEPRLLANLSFVVQQHKCDPLYRSVSSVTASIAKIAIGNKQRWLRSILFPEYEDGEIQETLSRGTFDLDWYDAFLNFEQKKAVDSVVKANYGRMPFLISGPPGTGKTKTIVETTLQLLRSTDGGHSPHLLVCAPSDPAADTIATRLSKHLGPSALFRLNGWTRSFAEVSSALLVHCHVENDLFALPDFQTMMAFKVVVTTCRDADMLIQARLTNISLGGMYNDMMEAFSPHSSKNYRHWTALLLDEAAQAPEPEALIPIQVVEPGTLNAEAMKAPQIIMAGDEYQLGPRLSLKKSKLGISLFQRMFERDVYSTHPMSRSNGLRPLTAAMLPIIRPAFCNLIRNYRSVPQILATPSVLFYHDTLVPEVTSSGNEVSNWAGWQAPNYWPVLFQSCLGPDAVESILAGNGTGAGSLTNISEAHVALATTQSLLNPRHHDTTVTTGIQPSEIMIMSPFSAQVNLLRRLFREAGLYGVNIGPLEVFQGLESRIVILCTTRTRTGPASNPSRFVHEDQSRDLGVIDEPQKFNVAITRAKEGLIVIGNPQCLICTDDLNWINFLEFCRRNGCVSGPGEWDFNSLPSIRVGRLERALLYATQLKDRPAAATGSGVGGLQGVLPTSDDLMWQQGVEMAEGELPGEEDEEAEEDADDTKSVSGQESAEYMYDLNPRVEMERAGCHTQ